MEADAALCVPTRTRSAIEDCGYAPILERQRPGQSASILWRLAIVYSLLSSESVQPLAPQRSKQTRILKPKRQTTDHFSNDRLANLPLAVEFVSFFWGKSRRIHIGACDLGASINWARCVCVEKNPQDLPCGAKAGSLSSGGCPEHDFRQQPTSLQGGNRLSGVLALAHPSCS